MTNLQLQEIQTLLTGIEKLTEQINNAVHSYDALTLFQRKHNLMEQLYLLLRNTTAISMSYAFPHKRQAETFLELRVHNTQAYYSEPRHNPTTGKWEVNKISWQTEHITESNYVPMIENIFARTYSDDDILTELVEN